MRKGLQALGRLKTGQIESIPVETLRSLMRYEPATGNLIWQVTRGKARLGAVAGTRHTHGYVQIKLQGKFYLAHRLAWLLMTGEWPELDIDHINGRKSDNRWGNLRLATKQENMHNFVKARVDSTSGLLGTSPSNGRWQSKIHLNGKTIYLGTFDTAVEAHATYVEAKRRLHQRGTL